MELLLRSLSRDNLTIYLFYQFKSLGNFKDKEHLKLRCLGRRPQLIFNTFII